MFIKDTICLPRVIKESHTGILYISGNSAAYSENKQNSGGSLPMQHTFDLNHCRAAVINQGVL